MGDAPSLLSRVLSVLLEYFPCIALILAAAWLWACTATKPARQGGRWRVFLLGCLPAFIIPAAIVACGMVFAVEPRREWGAPAVPEYPVQIINWLFFAHIPLAILLLVCWRRQWLAVGTSSIFAGYLSFAASFISYMSVTGRWL